MAAPARFGGSRGRARAGFVGGIVMLVSVIIKTHNEAARLRLVLASLCRQTVAIVATGSPPPEDRTVAEIIVADDGSTDETPALLAAEMSRMPLRIVRLEPNRGRSAAANAGARAATGELLLFLDGDTIAAPDLVERHATAHHSRSVMGRGENCHIRCTRYFHDPETGSPQPGCEEQVRRMGKDLARNCVTRDQVISNFAQVAKKGQPGLYPGAGPRRLFELEWDALNRFPDLEVLWMAAAGHNASVRTAQFEAVGGFDERLTINEHRELALRLQQSGVRLKPVHEAKTYHLTHRSGWRNPLADPQWERIFYEAHPIAAVKLMSLFWSSLAEDSSIPEEHRILSLPQMEAVARIPSDRRFNRERD
jgi:glycosyltransferase involved in cell wall biosynthesis